MAGGIQTTGGLSSPCYRHPSVTHHNPNWTHNPKHLKFHCKSVLRGTTEQIADTQQGLLSGGELSATTRRKNNSMSVAHSHHGSRVHEQRGHASDLLLCAVHHCAGSEQGRSAPKDSARSHFLHSPGIEAPPPNLASESPTADGPLRARERSASGGEEAVRAFDRTDLQQLRHCVNVFPYLEGCLEATENAQPPKPPSPSPRFSKPATLYP